MKKAINVFFRFVSISLFLLIVIGASQAQTVVPLSKYAGNLKTLQVIVSGKSFRFIFDTGGGETIVSPEIAELLGREVYGTNTGFRMHGESVGLQRCDDVSIKIGKIGFRFQQVAVWDIMSILPKDFPKIDGVVSLHTFKGKKLTLDLQHDRVIVETDKSFRRRIVTMSAVPAMFSSGLQGTEVNLFIEIPVGEHYYRFLFDTGNIDKTILAPSTAFAMGLKYDQVSNKRAEIGNTKLKVGRKFIEIDTAIDKIIYDGALDFGFISQSVYAIDLGKQKVWIR